MTPDTNPAADAMQPPPSPAPPRVRHAKPADFDARPLCGAKTGAGTCTEPREACRSHCGAFCRTTGRPCPSAPVAGAERCRMHNGKAPCGPAASGWIDGRSGGKLMPSRLRERYENHLLDPDLLGSRKMVAILDARLDEQCERLHDVEGGQLLRDIREAWAGFEAANAAASEARADGDEKGLAKAAADLRSFGQQLKERIAKGASQEEQWEEIKDTITHRNASARQEWQRMIELHAMVTVEQAMALFALVVAKIQAHVTDADTLKALTSDLAAVINFPAK